jgi:hypothetical protein
VEGGRGAVRCGGDGDNVSDDDGGDVDYRDGLWGDHGVVDAASDGVQQPPAASQWIGCEQVAGLALEDAKEK